MSINVIGTLYEIYYIGGVSYYETAEVYEPLYTLEEDLIKDRGILNILR